jgi:neopullulanase
MKKIVFAVAICCIGTISYAQGIDIYPTHWWVGMKYNKIQLMLHGDGIAQSNSLVTVNYPGVKVLKTNKVENNNYLFVDLEISPTAKPGKFDLLLKSGTQRSVLGYTLKPRRVGRGKSFAQGVTSSDFIYMLMPDRFSNGDESNDRIPGLRDQDFSRDSIFYRHGGDLQGIINHLDYLQELGVTTLWPTPVVENDVPVRSEHGYAATNHYKIERRFGGEQAYKDLSDELHRRGMKLIQDVVPNHVGSHHFTVLDLPMKDWLNQWPSYTNTNHREQSIFDPHGSIRDKQVMLNGWFTPLMPDLNQRNPYVANYIIQHYIWSIEEFGVDGFRIDTYKYNDLEFANKCNSTLIEEYPSFTLFGETMADNVLTQAYFTENNLDLPWKSNLPGTIDFQCLWQGISPALNEGQGWSSGVIKLYNTLSQDFVYKNPMNNVILLDNHDMTRFFSTVNENVDKLKTGIGWLLTCRGIPQLYYGTEILMKGVSNPDGLVRFDFPGGWKGDKQNKFTSEGRTPQEQEVFNWTKKLGNFRKNSSAIQRGKLLQYIPDDGVYVYFRYDEKQTVMCVINTNEKEHQIDFTKYGQLYNDFTKASSVTSDQQFSLKSTFPLGAKQMWVMELER